jgi:RimJ/RimL family protein N-acetyltransferase
MTMNKEFPTRIETERLYLRSYLATDRDLYYAISQKNRPHLLHYETGNYIHSIHSPEDADGVLKKIEAGWQERKSLFLGAFDRLTDEFVAQIYIGVVNWDLPEFEVGYFVDVEHEGRGYVSEAVRATLQFLFEDLQAHRIRLECDDTNLRSYKVAERCGFVREGHIREDKKKPDGTFSGTLIFGLLRSEYETLKPIFGVKNEIQR